MKKNVNIKILDSRIGKEIPFPSYSTPGSAGLDLRACLDKEIFLKSGEVRLLSTGIAVHISDSRLTGVVIPRSGLGHKNGIVLGNLIGLIDSDYQGQIKLSIWNRSNKKFLIKPGIRLAQLVFMPIIRVRFSIVTEFNSVTKRGDKGFGHSGLR